MYSADIKPWGLLGLHGSWLEANTLHSSVGHHWAIEMYWGSDFELVVSPLPHAAFHTGRGAAQSGAQRRAHRHQRLSLHRLLVWLNNMGLEKEKSDTSIIMDEDEFNRSIEPILSKKGKVYTAAPDRDPNDINAHLKVKSVACIVRNYSFKVKLYKAAVIKLNY